MIKDVKAFSLHCDRCDKLFTDTWMDVSVWESSDTAIEYAKEEGWKTVDNKHYCDKCSWQTAKDYHKEKMLNYHNNTSISTLDDNDRGCSVYEVDLDTARIEGSGYIYGEDIGAKLNKKHNIGYDIVTGKQIGRAHV